MSIKPHHAKIMHHIASGVLFGFLILWFYAGRSLGFLDWFVSYSPESHAGAALMLAIMLMMTPAFFIWKLANRFIERTLKITGRYYEEGAFADAPKKDDTKPNSPS
ncbi:hypothetical protein [Nitrincola nitratireducens]|uniref:Uncharacterized protein n=1 Tax=Nitrincola nitratireducens TaxID=1229521 RepID=W9UVT1_9GAMM|nr:hypothetical protein [Nitrincola nitratireducens]EXJ11199.1 hypothetical protein D791_01986 [Nitrincola nitratireducens]